MLSESTLIMKFLVHLHMENLLNSLKPYVATTLNYTFITNKFESHFVQLANDGPPIIWLQYITWSRKIFPCTVFGAIVLYQYRLSTNAPHGSDEVFVCNNLK